MLNDQELLRYSRQILLQHIDIDGQLRLKESRVLIVGLGGLGAPVALYLAAAGVGQLHLADFDTVDLTNLQRQIIHDTDSVGMTKVDSALKRLSAINPEIQLIAHRAALDEDSLAAVVTGVDLVLDCSDNFSTREAVNAACVASGKPLVSGAAIRLEGQLSVFDPRRPESPCYHCLYGHGSEAELTCSEAGVVGPLVGLVGSLQALEALKLLAGFGEPLVGRLLLIDALGTRFRELRVKRDPGCSVCGSKMREAPIGVFDSGVGGLSVLAEIQRLLPNESLLYVADCGNVPYGEKTPEFIQQRCSVMADFFQQQGAKALVLACNTATVAGVADLRRDYPEWPIVGMEPAVKPAAAATRSGVVGVLATTGTLQSAKFAALLDRFATDVRVITQPCPGLVELIENGDLHSPALRQLLAGYVEPLLAAGADTIILGCTHYPFLKPMLRQMIPENISLIDTGAAVARQLQRLLAEGELLAEGPAREAQFWTSADPLHFRNILPILWNTAGVVRSFNR